MRRLAKLRADGVDDRPHIPGLSTRCGTKCWSAELQGGHETPRWRHPMGASIYTALPSTRYRGAGVSRKVSCIRHGRERLTFGQQSVPSAPNFEHKHREGIESVGGAQSAADAGPIPESSPGHAGGGLQVHRGPVRPGADLWPQSRLPRRLGDGPPEDLLQARPLITPHTSARTSEGPALSALPAARKSRGLLRRWRPRLSGVATASSALARRFGSGDPATATSANPRRQRFVGGAGSTPGLTPWRPGTCGGRRCRPRGRRLAATAMGDGRTGDEPPPRRSIYAAPKWLLRGPRPGRRRGRWRSQTQCGI